MLFQQTWTFYQLNVLLYFHRQEFARAKDESGSVGEDLHKMDDKYQKQSGTIDRYFFFDPEAYFII